MYWWRLKSFLDGFSWLKKIRFTKICLLFARLGRGCICMFGLLPFCIGGVF
ncbi:hypothetical protein HanRHA438_Chr02g0056321 [Helianthus annuus]|nr:hypothetical protein HanRHA438_Chr02g0056321 [Helianthus annuus]